MAKGTSVATSQRKNRRRSRLSARHCHWGNAASPGTTSGAGTDSSRWEQDRDYKRNGQTPPSGTATAVVVYAASHEGELGRGAIFQRLTSVPASEKVPGTVEFP
ncbi:hypothetical protein AVEN_234223-1 [Araneus ventricosus]|uniref:Uncharacterized protein n=1 Tax=Araneus ventricosus TaxID=182803 RepID=A0A4Y2A7Z7_ARAVE|nr:hypothetical protein AVEN_234223-1 [Araneus ventricosus]